MWCEDGNGDVDVRIGHTAAMRLRKDQPHHIEREVSRHLGEDVFSSLLAWHGHPHRFERTLCFLLWHLSFFVGHL